MTTTARPAGANTDVLMRARYEAAPTLKAFARGARANAELWRAMVARAAAPADLIERARRVPDPRHLLVLLEDWCGDAVNTIPPVAALAAAVPDWDLRVLARDEHLDLMNAHRTRGARAIPVVLVLDAHYRELGWWGPRPAPLQAWVVGPGQALGKEERYKEVRRWYARDRAATTLEEVVALVERTGGATEGHTTGPATSPALQGV